ncbi:MAG: nitronate monooxygenase [Proteobacteria bacterium]|nr:nitronate monooxygenase [Pseudomonadota bacterium]
MIHTRICEILGIEHPIALGGMPSAFNSPQLVAAVSNAGAIGMIGSTHLDADAIHACAKSIRKLTAAPFAFNSLMFLSDEAGFAASLETKPSVISLSWPRKDQDVAEWIRRSHDAGCKVTYMAGDVGEAIRGAEAGADIIVAQGTEGGGHVGWMGTAVLIPLIVDAVTPTPVMAAGGIADGRGFAAALALGAEGILLGTRFLASKECGIDANYKQAILDSDGHDTVLTEIPDIAASQVWPGGMSRVKRNRFVERWSAREWLLRQNLPEAVASVAAARKNGDTDEAPLFYGQDAGLIKDLPPAAAIIERLVADAESQITTNLAQMIR